MTGDIADEPRRRVDDSSAGENGIRTARGFGPLFAGRGALVSLAAALYQEGLRRPLLRPVKPETGVPRVVVARFREGGLDPVAGGDGGGTDGLVLIGASEGHRSDPRAVAVVARAGGDGDCEDCRLVIDPEAAKNADSAVRRAVGLRVNRVVGLLRGSGGSPVAASGGRLPVYFEWSHNRRYYWGPGASSALPRATAEIGCRRLFLVSDAGVEAAGLLRTIHALDGQGLRIVHVTTSIPTDSDVDLIGDLARAYRKAGCDGIVAVGGGSVLDTAKALGVLAGKGGDDFRVWNGSQAIPGVGAPVFAVPTTAGTGSESTRVSVLHDTVTKRKLLFVADALLPTVALLDPHMTATLPPQAAAVVGMDALSHAVEARYCLARNPISDRLSEEAVAAIAGHLPAAVAGGDEQARAAVLYAANLAGQAFSNSMVGMIHALGHSVGALTGLPHALCMSVLLPYGLEFNLPVIADELRALAPCFAADSTGGADEPEAVIRGVRRLARRLKELTGGRHPLCFAEMKKDDGTAWVPKDALPGIARFALDDGAVFYNPLEMRYDDAMAVLDAAWAGSHRI